MKMNYKALIGAVAGLAIATTAFAADITGAGASFPFPIYAKWAAVYKGVSGTGLNYQSIGSGGGIKQVEAKTVTIASSLDSTMAASRLAARSARSRPLMSRAIFEAPMIVPSGPRIGETVREIGTSTPSRRTSSTVGKAPT